MTRTRRLRWRALGPLGVFALIGAVLWWLFADRVVHDTVEDVGADFIGARVDLEYADIRLTDGVVVLRGLEVANPMSPMTNLVQADEIIVMVDPVPLLEKKVVIDTLAFRGMRFGTARSTSGAIDRGSAATDRANRTVGDWVAGLSFPSLTLDGLSRLTNVRDLSLDSLRTAQAARALTGAADSTAAAWRAQLSALDPAPMIDSARALAQTLQSLRPNPLALVRAREQVTTARALVGRLQSTQQGLAQLEETAREVVPTLRQRLGQVAALRQEDYAYALRRLELPSLDRPDVSSALLGHYAAERVAPIVYWANVVADHLPPGLDPRRRTGPDRARRAGTSVVFPRETAYPAFLVAFAEATMSLGGETAAAGDYALQLQGLTTEPEIYGRPLLLSASRLAAPVGPRSVEVNGLIDHRRRPVRDSVRVRVGGLALHDIPIASLNTTLVPGVGNMEVGYRRSGDSLAVSWAIRSDRVTWERPEAPAAADTGRIGSRAWTEALLWRAVSGLRDVDIEIRATGTLRNPRLAVSSNIGRAVARSLESAIGDEVRRAEARARAEVDRRVGEAADLAETSVSELSGELLGRITGRRTELDDARAELERQIEEATRRVLGGVRIP